MDELRNTYKKVNFCDLLWIKKGMDGDKHAGINFIYSLLKVLHFLAPDTKIQEIFGTNWDKSPIFAIGNKADFCPNLTGLSALMLITS